MSLIYGIVLILLTTYFCTYIWPGFIGVQLRWLNKENLGQAISYRADIIGIFKSVSSQL